MELTVLVVEDEADVRASVVRDLSTALHTVRIEEAESADDAVDALREIHGDGDVVGLIIADHRLPGRTGVDLLVSLHQQAATRAIRKILLTGQADQDDTIRALNDGGLNHYIAKPWTAQELVQVSVRLLTDFVIEQGLDPLRHVSDLDGPRLLEAYGRHPRAE